MSTAPTIEARRGNAYSELERRSRERSLLRGTEAILSWDQETMMPEGGVAFRGDQIAQLARMIHELSTDPRIGELLLEAEQGGGLPGDPNAPQRVNLREWRRDHEIATRLPASLVEELARAASIAQHEWAAARKASEFARFRPHLAHLLELNRRKAECLGWSRSGGEPWDALADTFEPGCTAAAVEAVFTPLAGRLQGLIDRIRGASKRPSDRFDRTAFPEEAQERFVRFVAESIGFDFTRGRLDRSTHPFCGGSHRGDVRLTTRFKPELVLDALSSTMHECGHGIYEQGLPAEHLGTPMGEAVSLAVHESQSRLWENQVGRSREFWGWLSPRVKSLLGPAAAGFSHEELYAAANRVEPGFIRVEADEATYNLHIMIRFDLERRMLRGDLVADDLPAAWNEAYRKRLGLEVPDDRRGCLQDVHWSIGAMGYFPTYTLGNLVAAGFFEAASRAIPDLPQRIGRGEFATLREWLHEEVHAHGRRHRSAELHQLVTGEAISADPLMRHLEGKLAPLYGL
jgi:carboxypeptidase Taq